ncbi:uncharacterized protein RAG0_02591 [Rhynchosporium agropyri]|uniref:Altered inheritance of mitochondria protein 41 n=1 Tax=Rhynchosporium agropyri TaxID=914238 RepID=A0A1E1K1S8_9HELO|nr:uncharacterized protein RAG0_02591 [Rhynchosporium agropyri]
MRNKDTVRLRVVRSLLAQAKRASETKPIETDAQMLKVLTQNINANRDAAEEFTKSGRADLAEKEDQERAIMDEYKDSVPKVGEADLAAVRERIELVLKQLQEQLGGEFKRETVKVGDVLKRVLEGKEGEEILGKFERGEVVKVLMPMLKGTK